MTASTTTPHISDPVFFEAQNRFQKGEWESGLEKLDILIERYPSKIELRDYRNEMVLRARVDEYEHEEKKADTKKNIFRWGGGITIFIFVVALLAWGISSYSSWIQDQWSAVRQSLDSEVQSLDLTIKFNDAQNYLSAGRSQDALTLIEVIEAQNPDYPGLKEIKTDVSRIIYLEEQYQNALEFEENGNLEAALAAYKNIQSEKSGYYDVPLRIQEIESTLILNELHSQAESAYEQEDWENAAFLFESLRDEAPKYQPEIIEEKLIASYINAAKVILEGEGQSSEDLILADSYFRNALGLRPMDAEILAVQDQAFSIFKEKLFRSYLEKARETLVDNDDSLGALAVANGYYELALDLFPNDPEVVLERKLTNAYLIAQQSFIEGNWDYVIENLESVYEQDKEFAGGTSRQTLYDAYMKRGRRSITNGEYEAAIEDFQRAAEIADESPEAVIHVYWSLIEMAEVYGILGEYEKAVSLYNHAVEWIGLRDILQQSSPQQVYLLDEAERYAGIEWFRTSYRLYNRFLPAEELIYASAFHDVQEGDYLTQIASLYRTTVEAILKANKFSDPGDIRTGKRILIPILRGDND